MHRRTQCEGDKPCERHAATTGGEIPPTTIEVDGRKIEVRDRPCGLLEREDLSTIFTVSYEAEADPAAYMLGAAKALRVLCQRVETDESDRADLRLLLDDLLRDLDENPKAKAVARLLELHDDERAGRCRRSAQPVFIFNAAGKPTLFCRCAATFPASGKPGETERLPEHAPVRATKPEQHTHGAGTPQAFRCGSIVGKLAEKGVRPTCPICGAMSDGDSAARLS